MTNEQIREIFLSKENKIKKCFKEKVTYENWDKKSPVFVYSILSGDIYKFENTDVIKYVLSKFLVRYCIAFTNKEAAEIYKWLYDTIAHEIDNRICEGFTDNINKFVEHRELHVRDTSVFTVTEV